jgi:hypothetical protein
MKLQSVSNGRVYATDARTVLVSTPELDGFERIGRLPTPTTGRESIDFHLKSTRPVTSVVERIVGRFPTTNLWVLDSEHLLATAGRWVFRSTDSGHTWHVCLELAPSSGTMGVLPSAVCYNPEDGVVLLGEYPLGDDVTRILRSTDHGCTWTVATRLPDVRHVHAIQRDPYTGDVWITTGDTDDESHVGRLQDGHLNPVGGGSQEWRAVELVFTPTAILWGMDCVYADRNNVFRLDRTELETARPTPDRVHSLPSSVYYGASLTVDDTTCVAFSTAVETGDDGTAPGQQSADGGRAVVVASSSASDYTSWTTLTTYEKRPCLTDLVPLGQYAGALRSNAYVFLGSHPTRGLLLNPYNTQQTGGAIHAVSPRRLLAATAEDGTETVTSDSLDR